jgi:hypothetical protein
MKNQSVVSEFDAVKETCTINKGLLPKPRIVIKHKETNACKTKGHFIQDNIHPCLPILLTDFST